MSARDLIHVCTAALALFNVSCSLSPLFSITYLDWDPIPVSSCVEREDKSCVWGDIFVSAFPESTTRKRQNRAAPCPGQQPAISCGDSHFHTFSVFRCGAQSCYLSCFPSVMLLDIPSNILASNCNQPFLQWAIILQPIKGVLDNVCSQCRQCNLESLLPIKSRKPLAFSFKIAELHFTSFYKLLFNGERPSRVMLDSSREKLFPIKAHLLPV